MFKDNKVFADEESSFGKESFFIEKESRAEKAFMDTLLENQTAVLEVNVTTVCNPNSQRKVALILIQIFCHVEIPSPSPSLLFKKALSQNKVNTIQINKNENRHKIIFNEQYQPRTTMVEAKTLQKQILEHQRDFKTYMREEETEEGKTSKATSKTLPFG